MLHARRALLLAALTAVTLALGASAASSVTINPLGPITLTGAVLQTIHVPSTGATYTCTWTLNGNITNPAIQLGGSLQPIDLHPIGEVIGATVTCNQPGVTVTPLVSPPGTTPGPWTIGTSPGRVLGLPDPTGMLVEILDVGIRIDDPNIGFRCLFTGTLGILFADNSMIARLLLSGFVATGTPGDTCPQGLPMTKGAGTYNVMPPLIIGP